MRSVRYTLASSLSILAACSADEEIVTETDLAVPSCSEESRGCADGRTNDDETDTDCGGARSPKCLDGKACLVDASCASGYCRVGVCSTPRGDDRAKNGDETDVDCGGTKTKARKCVIGMACRVNADCMTNACGFRKVCVDRSSSANTTRPRHGAPCRLVRA